MSTVGDLSQTFILDLGLGSPKKILLTPQDLPLFSSLHDDSLEGDYFSIDTTLTKRQRLSLHPTRQSSTSLASTTSSATPSEADSSDLIDLAAQDDDETGAEAYQMEMLAQNKRSQVGSAEGELGLGFYMNNTSSSGMLPTSVHLHNPLEQGQQRAQVAAVSSHATMALSSFNLSDFISYDQEHTQNRHNNHHSFEARANMFATPEKPITARDMRILAMTRSSSFSSAMTSSPKTPANGGNYHDRLSALGYQEAQRHMEGTQGQYLERPKFPLRTFSTPEESLSCNPAQITPSHQRFGQDASSEDDARSQNSYFLSSPGSAFHEKLDKGRQDFSASPPSPYSSPLESHPGLWNSLPQGERERDVFDGELPLHESRPVATSFSSPLPHTPQHHQLQLENSAHRSSPQGRGGAGGALRNARLSSLAAKRQSMSPYQSPLSDHGAFDSPPGSTTHMLIGGQTVTGIITKRSRGRRVPNNPHELNNLGKSGKVYTCKVPGCGKCFKRSEHLKRHVRSIHTNDKPFTCHCGKTFSRHDNLNQHARVHATGEEEVFGNAGSPSSTASPMSLPAAFAKTHLDGDDGAYFESE